MNYVAGYVQNTPSSPGVGDVAKEIAGRLDRISFESKESCSKDCLQREYINSALIELYSECSYEGWDGHGAAALSENVKRRASDLVRNLPNEMLTADIDITPDGQVAMIWQNKRFPTKLLTLVIGGDTLYYACRIGGQRFKNKLSYGFVIPHEIRTCITLVINPGR